MKEDIDRGRLVLRQILGFKLWGQVPVRCMKGAKSRWVALPIADTTNNLALACVTLVAVSEAVEASAFPIGVGRGWGQGSQVTTLAS
jgi:hypothetical protein